MTSRGYGFVKTPEGEFFIPRSGVGEALDGDLVEVRPTSRRRADRGGGGSTGRHRSLTGRVCAVLERGRSTIVGRYEVAEPFGVVVPLDPRLTHDIFTRRSDAPTIADGAIVRVKITAYPTRSSAACGVVEDVLSSIGDGDTEILYERYSLPRAFGDAALAEAQSCVLDVEGSLAAGYKDLRERTYVTIDPADARDFDDAIYVEPLEGASDARWRLGVAIADVSAYVAEGGPLDLEARARGTSVYLADRVVPMLPEELSNDLCSLAPGVARLVLNVDLEYDESYRRLSSTVYPAIIRSRAALAYDRVQALLDGATPDAEEATWLPMLERAAALGQALEKARIARGALEFSTVEPKATLDDEGNVIGIDLREKTVATGFIESAMIEANEAVASWMERAKAPMIYRVHERPDAEALAGLEPILKMFPWFTPTMAAGLALGEPAAMQAVLAAAEGRPEELLVGVVLLRTQQRARYSPENIGHFGLGARVYTHFTSPIRRYPDLVVHRKVKARLGFSPNDSTATPESVRAELATIADHSSAQERNADEAARASQSQKMARYMADHLGEEFDGVISGVAAYGLYVALDIGPEGLIRIGTLPDGPYAYRPSEQKLVGFKERRSFRLGERVRVSVLDVDLARYEIHFGLSQGARRQAD